MARTRYPSVKDAAAEILREVHAERLVKTAEQQILRQVEAPRTDVGEDLTKLAAAMREVDVDNPEVTYADLHNFMAQCNER
jgi:hypothetical protein